MFRRIVSLKSSRLLEGRVAMAYNKQDRGRKSHNRQANRREGGGFPNPNAKPFYGNRERHIEYSQSSPWSEASKDYGVQGDQFNNNGSDYNSGKPRPPGSYPYNEDNCDGTGQGRGDRSNNRERAQQNQYHGVGYDQSRHQWLQPVPDLSDSQKGHGQQAQSGPNQGHGQQAQSGPNQGHVQLAQSGPNQGHGRQAHLGPNQGHGHNQGHGQQAQSGPNQGYGQQAQSGPNQSDSQKGDIAQRNSIQDDVDQGYGQGAKPDSFQGDSQEGSVGYKGPEQGAEPISCQGHSQENTFRGQQNEDDSRQGFQDNSQKGSEGHVAQVLHQQIEPDAYHQGHFQEVKPTFATNVWQKGKEEVHMQGASPSYNKENLKVGSDVGQSQGNNSIQRTQSSSQQKRQGNDSGQRNNNGQEGMHSRQTSSGGRLRRDNFDQQQTKRNRADDDDIFLSKTLSFILRHGAEKQNFKLMPGGFLYVDEILQKMRKLEGFTVKDVLRIVEQNDKQRFAVQKEDGTGRLKIRANQGHTMEVEDLELTPITSADQVPMVLHGTYYNAWNSIKKEGLCRFKRNHIHFAAGQPGENGVISGMRSSCEVMIYIDLEKALKDGLKFYLSANNVILSPGNEEGYIYPCYFNAVVNRHPYHILEFDPSIKGKKKTVSADQISKESDKNKKKNNKKKRRNKEDKERNESGAQQDEVEGDGDSDLLAGVGEKLKEMNIEEMDEEDHFVDAIETEPERLMQSQVPDQWDDADKVERDQKSWINSKGEEESEGTQGLAESEDPKGTKELKTKEKESLHDTSKGASKSDAQSMSQALKRATKPETAKGSVIPKSEQKGTFTPEDEDEGAATEVTADGEDVKVEEEWTTVSITNVEESQSAVEYILEQNEPVTIICCGEKQGDADGKITLLLISMQNKTWIYQLCSMEGDVMEAGKLKQLFFDLNLMKVFHGVTWQSAVLFKQYDIVLDGTKVFDSKVVCKQNLVDDKAMETLRLGGFMPSRWVEEDGKIESSKWTQIPLDSELVNKLIERCKALLLFYEMFPMQKVAKFKKEIYEEVNKYVDENKAKEIRKTFRSQAGKPPPQEQPASSSNEQRKGKGSSKKGKKNKKK